jgi:hypothetical protein
MQSAINDMRDIKNLFIKNKTTVISFLGLFLVVTGISWAFFGYVFDSSDNNKASNTSSTTDSRKIDPSLPKTEVCPINGAKFSKPAKEVWDSRRPLTASIENHADARPQSGLSFADVVYEAVAEGGITRFLAVFYCAAATQDVSIAPIRSARVYFVDWATEYQNPIFMHVGGANNICGNCPGGIKPAGQLASKVDAFKMLEKLGWRSSKGNDFDGGTNVGYPIITRDQYRLGSTPSAWEHSVVGFTDKIFDEAKLRGFANKDYKGAAWDKNFVQWKFTDEKPSSTANATKISFGFWSNKGDYDVSWAYDSSTNSYLRSNGGTAHKDHETNEQISAKNVVVQFVKEEGPVDKEGHMFYQTTGKGESLYFQNGTVIKGTWEKSPAGRTRFYDESGKEIQFVRGVIWIEGVPAGNKITY